MGRVDIRNPNLTIAGQTAPGGGIQIRSRVAGNAIVSWADNIIIRYIRVRKDDSCPPQGPGTECGASFVFNGGANVILDHVTSQWNEDENVASSYGRNFTVSNSILAEGARSHSTASLLEDLGDSTLDSKDIHHNLLMNTNNRNPQIDTGRIRMVNNIIYNNVFCSTQIEARSNGSGQTQVDIIGNLYKKGPLNDNHPEISGITAAMENNSLYLSGNKGWNQPNPSGDQWIMVRSGGVNCSGSDPVAPTSWRRSSPLPQLPYPITAEPVASIESPTGTLIPHVGASRRLDCNGNWIANRDSQDTKLINQLINNTGTRSLSETPAGYGGFPNLAAGTPCPDADHDGMPDAWETSKGLNPNNPADGSIVAPANSGYTNLEVYLAGSGATLPCIPPSCGGGGTPPPPTGPHVELTITPACFADANLNTFALAEHPSAANANTNQPSLSFLDLLKRNLASVFFWQ